jgi:hypothetical protein
LNRSAREFEFGGAGNHEFDVDWKWRQNISLKFI